MVWGQVGSYLLVFSLAATITYLATPAVRYVSLKLRIIDETGIRKLHAKIVTRMGGVAIYVGFVFAAFCSFLISPGSGHSEIPLFVKMLSAGTVLMLLGVYDDIKGARPKLKFFVQILAALLLISMGVAVDRLSNPFFGGAIDLGYWSVPVTVLWLVGITNAINLVDGLDGLAGGIVCISCFGMFFAYFFTGIETELPIFLAISLAGAVLAFLKYNFYPSKIFMGDTGSMFIGFTIAAISIIAKHKATASIGLFIPIIFLAIPILDTVLAFSRRLIKGKSPFRADKKHIHHWLLSKNVSHERTVILILALTLALNVAGVLLALIRNPGPGM